jgi:hypothetical protein
MFVSALPFLLKKNRQAISQKRAIRPMVDDNVHIRCVGDWMKHAARVPPEERTGLFEKAVTALWLRTHSALGDITVAAIVDRVLCNATEKYPVLSSLKLDTSGISFEEFRQQAASINDRELIEAFEFVLVELLTVVGNLTADILTPALHSELSSVIVKESRSKQSGEKKL